MRATTPRDYANFILACLAHDIGYVRGILQGDDHDEYVADHQGPYRSPAGADRPMPRWRRTTSTASKLFVIERFDMLDYLDADRIARAIEYTRFPYPSPSTDNHTVDDLNEEEGLLLRAADLIGQLGDPNYMRKANALFHEFDEIGLTKTLGYKTPADVVYKYPQFYWKNVAPQIPDRHPLSQRDLERTAVGRQPLQQRLPRRAQADAVGAADVGASGAAFSRSAGRLRRGGSQSRRQFSASAGSPSAGPTGTALSPQRHDGQNTKSPPPVLPDESSPSRKNIPVSEIRNSFIVLPPRLDTRDVMAIRHQT